MDKASIIEEVGKLATRREFLVQLLDKSDLGILEIDVQQALDELNDLLEEFKQTFPEETLTV